MLSLFNGSVQEEQISAHGIYIRWQLRCRCARKELSDLFKTFNKIESSDESDIFYPKRTIFLRAQHVLSYHLT